MTKIKSSNEEKNVPKSDVTYGTAVRSFNHASIARLAAYPALREALNDLCNQSAEVTLADRSWWEVQPAPRFSAEPVGFLAETIPPMPSLVPAAAEGGAQ